MAISTLAVVMLLCLPATAQPSGTRIDRSNADQVAALLPPPVLAWVRQGDLTLTVGEMRDEVAWDAQFLAASGANAGRYGIDGDGGLIDVASGKRPPHTYGFPFPDIDPGDPNAGVQVMWNATVVNYKFGRIHTPFALHWVGRGGFERLVRGRVLGMAFDYQPEEVAQSDGTETRDLFRATGPGSADGIASLTWRYSDNRPDSVWGYSPAIRRVRQLTAANRSDPAYGSDITQDDGFLWLGKNQSFTWKLIGSQDVLVSTVATQYVPLLAGRKSEHGQEWRSPTTFPGARFGWETEGWAGAPWLATNAVWVKRPVWIVEGNPKDPYYSYGRQLFYIDKSTFKIYYKVVHTRAGEYWKTLLNDLAIGTTPDGGRQVVVAALIAVDDRAHHASYSRGNAPDFITEYNSALAEPALFTVNGLLRYGK